MFSGLGSLRRGPLRTKVNKRYSSFFVDENKDGAHHISHLIFYIGLLSIKG